MFCVVKKMDERVESPVKLLLLDTSFKNLSPFHSPPVAEGSSWDGPSFQSVYVQHARERKALASLKLVVLLHLHITGTDYFYGTTTTTTSSFDSVNSLFWKKKVLGKTFVITLLIFRKNFLVSSWKAGIGMCLWFLISHGADGEDISYVWKMNIF